MENPEPSIYRQENWGRRRALSARKDRAFLFPNDGKGKKRQDNFHLRRESLSSKLQEARGGGKGKKDYHYQGQKSTSFAFHWGEKGIITQKKEKASRIFFSFTRAGKSFLFRRWEVSEEKKESFRGVFLFQR